jgi:GNAT superfamily N-acetyltransferase
MMSRRPARPVVPVEEPAMTLHHDLPALDAARASDAAEAAAFADLFEAAPSPLREALGLEVHRLSEATLLLAPRLPTPMFNRVIGLGLGAEFATLDDVEAIATVYRDAGVADWWIHWNPHAQPEGFDALLRERGWRLPARHHWAKMLRAAGPARAVATSLHVSAANDVDAVETAQAIARAFDMPPPMATWLRALHGRPGWRLYAARDGDRVVGGGCLHVDGERVWLGMGAVLPDARGRGGQQALMARRIDDAIAAGARWIATETGEPIADEPNPSLENMRRMGFEAVASRLNLAAPPAAG